MVFGDEDPYDALQERFDILKEDYNNLENDLLASQSFCRDLQERLDKSNTTISRLKKQIALWRKQMQEAMEIDGAPTKNSR